MCSDVVTYANPTGTDPSTVFLRQRVGALNRVAAELRQWLADAPADDPQVASLLRDCDTLEEVARILAAPPVKITQPGIPANGTATVGT